VPKSTAAFTSDRLKAANKKDLACLGKGLANNNVSVVDRTGDFFSRHDDLVEAAMLPKLLPSGGTIRHRIALTIMHAILSCVNPRMMINRYFQRLTAREWGITKRNSLDCRSKKSLPKPIT